MRALRLQKSLPSIQPGMVFGAFLSFTVGLILYAVTARTIESDTHERFRNIARSGQYSIAQRIKSYTDLLRGTASVFQAKSDLTRDEFQRYVEGLATNAHFPGIEVINYAEHVPADELAALERRVSAEMAASPRGYPPFKVHPPGRRPTHTVLTFIEPPEAWGDKFGLDLDARPHVAQALARSRDTGLVGTSGTRVFVLSGPNKHGLGMRLPVYRNGWPTRTVAERRRAYVGTVGIGFGVKRMLTGVLDEMAFKGMRLVLRDPEPVPGLPGENPAATVLFDSSATTADPSPAPDQADPHTFFISLPVKFNHRNWIADFSLPKAGLYTRFDVYYPWVTMLAGFITSALLYALFQTLATSRSRAISMAETMTRELRASQAKLQTSHATLRRLAAHAEQIKEGERKRIAREIHDDLGQNLLALRIEADLLASRTASNHPRLHARARATLQQIDITIKSVRQIINDLRPNVLDLGLSAAVDWLVADFRRRTGIECDVFENEADLPIGDACSTALFRILQESLNNILRHANATSVQIELHLAGGTLMMSVRDNGIGIQEKKRHHRASFGLVGIEERVNLLGGRFSIESTPGAGTTVTVSVPLHGNATVNTDSVASEHTLALDSAVM
jgi:signal transduction histidine kinase